MHPIVARRLTHVHASVHGRRQKPFVTNVFFHHTHCRTQHTHTCVTPVKRQDIRGKLFCCRTHARKPARTRMCKNPSDRYRRCRGLVFMCGNFVILSELGPGPASPADWRMLWITPYLAEPERIAGERGMPTAWGR